MTEPLQVQKIGAAAVELNSGSIREMEARLAEIEAKLKLSQDFFKRVMEKDTDYGIIPGTKKPSLLQPGADKLNSLYGFAKTIVDKMESKDYATGHYDVSVKVRLVHKATGITAGEGEGSACTRESKYRYRWVYEKDLPKSLDKDSLVSKDMEGQYGPFKLYRIENEDLFSQWNTVLKMAIKRAYVGATLASTGLSSIFTYAENELDAWIDGEPGDGQEGQDGQKKQGQAPGQKNQQPRGQNQNQNRSGPGSSNNRGGNANVASEKQIKAIFAIGKSKGLSQEDVKQLALVQVGKEPNNGMSSQEASNLIGFMQSASPEELQDLLRGGEDYSGYDDDNLPEDLFPDQGGNY
ncbi:hypothetical protein [Candidatus Formimonas warabiya]|uniref:Uncharacterized protein n=1 Tax=Formimonas warabiya TaxID=1761012 RepID=A0A3G1KNS3_FORW1|nr:hypothetical protein [Candidatus Formimonas warabiya]ATW24131.1 hypothetical protein DCMF_04455 [Candidatus Formimonas warabiya]